MNKRKLLSCVRLSRPEYWSGKTFPSPGDLPNPGNEPRSPALQADSLLSEPQGKPKNTGVGSLSLIQQIFSTQELNQGLLHCRRIIYQLSYERSPVRIKSYNKKPFEQSASLSGGAHGTKHVYDRFPCHRSHYFLTQMF